MKISVDTKIWELIYFSDNLGETQNKEVNVPPQ